MLSESMVMDVANLFILSRVKTDNRLNFPPLGTNSGGKGCRM